MKKLETDFYLRPDVVQVAKDLLGKILVTNCGNNLTAVMITETEAYAGATDRASHAYGNKYTARTAPMFKNGGIAYVYLCYGIHHLFNVVTNTEGIPHAVLIRAGQPLEGLELMLKRRNKLSLTPQLTNGPGSLSAALGITTKANASNLRNNSIWIAEHLNIKTTDITASPRVGIDYAGTDAKLPYRFRIKNNLFIGK